MRKLYILFFVLLLCGGEGETKDLLKSDRLDSIAACDSAFDMRFVTVRLYYIDTVDWKPVARKIGIPCTNDEWGLRPMSCYRTMMEAIPVLDTIIVYGVEVPRAIPKGKLLRLIVEN